MLALFYIFIGVAIGVSFWSLREDGIETILINSNPATIMTDPSMARN